MLVCERTLSMEHGTMNQMHDILVCLLCSRTNKALNKESCTASTRPPLLCARQIVWHAYTESQPAPKPQFWCILYAHKSRFFIRGRTTHTLHSIYNTDTYVHIDGSLQIKQLIIHLRELNLTSVSSKTQSQPNGKMKLFELGDPAAERATDKTQNWIQQKQVWQKFARDSFRKFALRIFFSANELALSLSLYTPVYFCFKCHRCYANANSELSDVNLATFFNLICRN